jgi:hypothetical protein
MWQTRVNAWASGSVPAGRVPYAGLLLQASAKGLDPFTIGLFELRSGLERASGSGSR